MANLGVNIDHVATLRQARREFEPNPVCAARVCEKAGANSIVAHLREDRRHINDADVRNLRKIVSGKFNLEMSINPEIVKIALRLRPDQATLVPEKRQEITTEGGLDVVAQFSKIKKAVNSLQKKDICVSLFIDPVKAQIKKSYETSAQSIEIHTGRYARARGRAAIQRELATLLECVRYAKSLGLTVHAGHGLNYKNAKAVARIAGIEELNIGHSIISRAVFAGLNKAVREMIAIIR